MLVVEDIQPVVVGRRKVVLVEPVPLLIDIVVVVLVVGIVGGTVEVGMAMALVQQQHMDEVQQQ